MKLRKLVILGAGGFADEVASIASDVPGVEIDAFVEAIDKNRCGTHRTGVPIVWIDAVSEMSNDVRGICAVGTTRRHNFIQSAAERGLQFTTIVHPTAVVASTAVLGTGVFIGAGVVVGARSQVGNHSLINRGCLIGHHVIVRDFATIGPGSNVGGYARIGHRAYIGMGAVVLDRMEVGDMSAVGAGSVVTRNVQSSVLVVGSPARFSRDLPEGM
ncbi:MAG: NeuD/PglB/VioB family sugar acetyltransferase [Rhodothermia bacterium]|nr:NeuD/PglB/VioB family sugar acetyltransferase [Rhodothermia bacterium]